MEPGSDFQKYRVRSVVSARNQDVENAIRLGRIKFPAPTLLEPVIRIGPHDVVVGPWSARKMFAQCYAMWHRAG